LDVLAEMIAYDGTLKLGSHTAAPPPPQVNVEDIMREMGMDLSGGVPGVGLD